MCPCLFLCCSFFKVQKLSYVKRRYHFLLRIALVESQPESTRLLQFPRRLGQSELSQSYRRYQDTNEFGFVETPSFFMCFYFSSKLNRPKILMVKKSFEPIWKAQRYDNRNIVFKGALFSLRFSGSCRELFVLRKWTTETMRLRKHAWT